MFHDIAKVTETGEEMRNNLLKGLGVVATIGIFLVLLAGVVVTQTDSGDGCGPVWPLCHGKLFPDEPTFETVIEYTHRLVTGIVGLIIVIFSFYAVFVYRKEKEVHLAAFGSLFFLVLQSALGALAVVFGQSSAVMALHFGFSLLSYAFVFILTLQVFQLSKYGTLPSVPVSNPIRLAVLGLFILSYLVVYLGALITHTSSEGGCTGWPLCSGSFLLPDWSASTVIHFSHRLSALLLLIFSAALMAHISRSYSSYPLFKNLTNGIFILVIAQIFSGGLLVLSQFNLYASIFHTFFVTLMFGLLCYTVLYVFRRPA